MNTNHEYSYSAQNNQFWTAKNRPVVIGDVLGRSPSLGLVGAKAGELILDAGSGAGYMARCYAKAGATVVGVENNPDMLLAARKINEEEKLPILYTQGDIVTTDFGYNVFDTVSCIAVLFHLSRTDFEQFCTSAFRALKPGGKFVLSFSSRNLINVTKNQNIDWVRYSEVHENDKGSLRLTEFYKNSIGQLFVSEVWYHETSYLSRVLEAAGFEMICQYERVVTEDALKEAGITGPTGYVAFEQLECRKP